MAKNSVTTKQKVMGIIEAIFIIALGVIIAVSGGGAALNIYLGVVALVSGAALAAVAIIELVQTGILPFLPTFLSCALISIGAGVFAGWISFDLLITLVVFMIIGLGGALIIHGIFLIAKKFVVNGLVEIIFGAVALTLAIIFLLVPEFRVVFWIIAGILVALYGGFLLVTTIIKK